MSIESHRAAAPKTEPHVHLEGAIQPATLLTLAERNGVRLPAPRGAGVIATVNSDDPPLFNTTRNDEVLTRRRAFRYDIDSPGDRESDMIRIARDQLVYGFDASTPPVATISPGDSVTVETYDTSTGRIQKPGDVPAFVAVRDPKKVNPAAGPIYVEGAEPGDALAVRIDKIALAPLGFARALKNAGVVQEGIREFGVVMVRVDGDHLIYGDKLRFPARTMVGVIGTAPPEGTIYTAHPGPQGSNIDLTIIREGATVYLPVHHPGGLLAIGDVHASMGDGEVCGTGVEINGEVTVIVDLLKGEAPGRIWVETPEAWATTGQGESLDDAVKMAVEGMTAFLMRRFDLDKTEAFLLVSARGDVRIGQCARIAGTDATAYVVFPRDVERIA